jgi:CRISPR-associated protein Csb2
MKPVPSIRPSSCVAPKPAVFRLKSVNSSNYAIARFALDAPILPLVADTLPVAEIARSCIMGQYQRLRHRRAFGTAEKPYRELFRSPVLSGKDAGGEHLLNHGHAYYLPADEDGDGRIDHLTVYAEDGFGPDEVAALYAVRSLPVGQGEGLRVMLVGLGQRGDFTAAMFQRSSSWQSATPFLVSRYLKKRGRKKDPAELREAGRAGEFVRLVLLEELGRLRHRRPEVPEPARVEFLPEGRMGAQRLRPIQFKRFRRKTGDDGGQRPSGGFRIVFPEPVAGPICLGHSCHFGMGLFVPEEECGVRSAE